jgi:hypothetical protein
MWVSVLNSRAKCFVVFAPESAGNAIKPPLNVPSMLYNEARACQDVSGVNGSKSVVSEHNNGW